MLYMVTFTINIPQMLAYIPYMGPMGRGILNFINLKFGYENKPRVVDFLTTRR